MAWQMNDSKEDYVQVFYSVWSKVMQIEKCGEAGMTNEKF
jgi:hypothetical protein